MSSSLAQPKPGNLREQMLNRIATMPEEDVAELYKLLLLAEKLRLRREISQQAEGESAQGIWGGLAEFVAEYRSRKKSA